MYIYYVIYFPLIISLITNEWRPENRTEKETETGNVFDQIQIFSFVVCHN